MIELEHLSHDDPTGFYGRLWHDADYTHVIAEEDGQFYVRDENGSSGAYVALDEAFAAARVAWGEVTLAPANRLRQSIEVEDENDVGTYLLEYLATYGTAGIDAQALAIRVFERIEED